MTYFHKPAVLQGHFRTYFIKFKELNSFFLAAASSNRGHIQHPVSELDESTPGEEKKTEVPQDALLTWATLQTAKQAKQL
jgi:hypothetical protein